MSAGLGAASSDPATAQETAQESGANDEILVTGVKKKSAQRLIDTPASVTVIDAAALDARQFRDLGSLTYDVANVQFDDIGTTPGVANFAIRGLGVNSSIPSIDPTVGVVVDGVVIGINNGVVLDQTDVESVEILRGPQGVLFGRNVTGGAVVINTGDPPEAFEARLRASLASGLRGTGLETRVSAAVGGPVAPGRVSARLAVSYTDDAGWFERYLGGPVPAAAAIDAFGPSLGAAVAVNPRSDAFATFGAARTLIVRPALRFRSGPLAVTLKAERGESEGDGPAAQNHVNGLGVANRFFAAPRDGFDFSIDEPGFYDNRWTQAIVEATLDVAFGDGVVTNVFGWREFAADWRGDIDSTPLFLFHSDAGVRQDQVSNELRYAGRFRDRVDVTAGLYAFTQDILYYEERFLFAGARELFGGGRQDQRTLAAFAQIDAAVGAGFIVTLGGRYTYEDKDAEIANPNLNTAFCSVLGGSCPFDFEGRGDWSNFNPKVGLAWSPGPSVNLYAHWTQGVRSGGFNLRNTALASLRFLPGGMTPNPDFDPRFLPGPFDEETVNAFEVGAKVESPRAILSTALFYNDVNDMQRELSLADPAAGIVQVIANTADATIWGFEVEGRARLGGGFGVDGFVGHIDGSYDRVAFDISGDGVVDAADLALRIPRLSPWSYGAGLGYAGPAGRWGEVSARVGYAHRDRNAYTDNNLGVLNAVNALDARLALTAAGGALTLSVYGENLLNEVNFGGDSQLPASLGGGAFAPLARGRIVGLEATWRAGAK